MKKSWLLTLSKSTVFLNLIIQSCYTFKLPDTKSEESELSQSIASIFLGDSITGRFGETSGYSGAEASLDTNSDVLLDLIRGQPSDYNAEQTHTVSVVRDTKYEQCEDYTEEFGYSCVPYYQCSNGSIITDGAGLIDIRNGFGALNPEESKCPGFLDVCCKDPDFVAPPPKPKYASKCGRRNVNGLGARIQGFKERESQFGEWPGMCALLREESFLCGASLIGAGLVLTGAHCVDKFRSEVSSLTVRCGEWDTQHNTEPYPHQDLRVATVKIHPEFNARNLANDFAVLFMEKDFTLDFNVDTVCLPQPEENFDGRSCFATGWGKDQFGSSGQYQVVLKELEIPTVDRESCQTKLRQTRLGARFRLDPSFMCAGGVAGEDTCQGDGGGPLICPSPNDPSSYTQAGIVAWGIGCGGETPGVYAALAEAVCWIDMAVSCQLSPLGEAGHSSYFGYYEESCGSWLEDKLTSLTALPPRVRTVIEAQYKGCPMDYQSIYGDYSLDLSEFARIKNFTSS